MVVYCNKKSDATVRGTGVTQQMNYQPHITWRKVVLACTKGWACILASSSLLYWAEGRGVTMIPV